jgi:hypothetical protein
VSVAPTFAGEVQFRRYSDTSTQGVQIVLALHDREALEPLVSKAGKRFMAVLVEIGDDEQPVEPTRRKDVRGPLCREARDLCAMPDFQEWIADKAGRDAKDSANLNEQSAKEALCYLMAVSSRKQLDDPLTAAAFVKHIRVPFIHYQRASRE